MSADLKIKLLERSLLVDEMIDRCRDNIASLSEKIGLERKMLGRHNSEKMRLKKCVSNLNEIHDMLGTSPADMAPPPPPSADVPPPSSVGGGEPITIEVNHEPAIASISDVEASVPSGSPSKEVVAEASEERLGASTGGKNVDPHNGENHKSRRKRVEQVPQNKSLGHAGKETAAEKIIASLKNNPNQFASDVAKQLGVSISHVRTLAKQNSLTLKKKPKGRPPIVQDKLTKIISKKSDQSDRSIARDAGCAPKSVRNSRRKMAGALYRLRCPATGKYLHKHLSKMTPDRLILVNGTDSAWQGDEKRLDVCHSMLPSTGRFTIEKFEA